MTMSGEDDFVYSRKTVIAVVDESKANAERTRRLVAVEVAGSLVLEHDAIMEKMSAKDNNRGHFRMKF